eukprot:CAMPEP_0114230268 /NCGR_PEP_ID=MMETSP0058-20121206/3374_1 /TAXON_ID=36894 /ORGANISM="Pyramimonas parkeae, CCMP726" /LENGTH=340 /DNA_ID=CAMNT_0001341447 /DNA_START=41 /DNA_END=1063 /DNA_ORIENTATION=-
MVSHEAIDELHRKLVDTGVALPARFRALFSLRGIGGAQAIAAMLDGLKDDSALLRHEIAFCLGQMQDSAAVPFLVDILKNAEEHPMVRHEAAEALGAIATEECLTPLQDNLQDPAQEVRETCMLALRRLQEAKKEEGGREQSDGGSIDDAQPAGSTKERMAAAAAPECVKANSPYLSVDPAPALSSDVSTSELRAILLNEEEDMFQRYAALFALRNQGGKEAVDALTESLTSSSALLKHEVAYVLGQLQQGAAVETLAGVLENESENPMVRHEAAEALGSIADARCIELLRRHLTHGERIVAESCLVALDILDYENSGEFHYADMSSSEAASSPAVVEAH